MINNLIKAILIAKDNQRIIATIVAIIMALMLAPVLIASARNMQIISDFSAYMLITLVFGLVGWFNPEITKTIKGDSNVD